MDLIYCANGNPRFAEIAISHGFGYGAQLPGKTYYPIMFADQDWKKPDRERYMAGLAQHRPRLATVLDLERHDQLEDVLDWAEAAAAHVSEAVIIIPKAFGVIDVLPRRIGGRQVRLGYSVPTRYGGTEVPLWEFGGWPVHLLGGSPHAQMALLPYLDVRSADGNGPQGAAVNWNMVWANGRYVKLCEMAGRVETDAPYVAFDLSCRNIMAAWRELAYATQ